MRGLWATGPKQGQITTWDDIGRCLVICTLPLSASKHLPPATQVSWLSSNHLSLLYTPVSLPPTSFFSSNQFPRSSLGLISVRGLHPLQDKPEISSLGDKTDFRRSQSSISFKSYSKFPVVAFLFLIPLVSL